MLEFFYKRFIRIRLLSKSGPLANLNTNLKPKLRKKVTLELTFMNIILIIPI